MMRRVLGCAIATVWLLCLARGVGRARADVDAQTPCRFRVVVFFGEQRVLTPFFRADVVRQIGNSYQAALGSLAEVQVADAQTLKGAGGDPSWAEAARLAERVEKLGFDKAFADWHQISDQKTHFVSVQFDGSRYELRTRQYDGATGLASPLTRRAQTVDRELVARIACLMMRTDFGLVGAFDPHGKSGEMRVTFAGGVLGGPLDRWVHKGDVFAVSQVRQAGRDRQGVRVPWVLLQSMEEPADGECRCRVLSRYTPAFVDDASVVAYRCIRLGTASAPLRLQFVNEATAEPVPYLQVRVSAQNVGGSGQEEASTNADGVMHTTRPYPGLAFVEVLRGGARLAQVPVEVIEDLTVVCPVGLAPGDDERGRLALALRHLVQRADESLLRVFEVMQHLSGQKGDAAREEALGKARAGLADLHAEIGSLRFELAAIRTRAGQAISGMGALLGPADDRMSQLRAREEQLSGFVASLEKALKEENDPKRRELREKAARAQLLEDDAEFERAIQLYAEVVKEAGEIAKDPASQAAVKEYARRLDVLRRDWAVKNDEHKKARDFVYSQWPAFATAEQLKAHLSETRQAFDVLKKNNDRLTPLRLLRANTAHATRLAKRLNEIAASGTTDERKEGIAVQEELDKLTKDVTAYLNPAKPVMPAADRDADAVSPSGQPQP
jgi:hypothetical protein